MTPATTKIGLEFPVLTGRDTVIPNMIGAVGPFVGSYEFVREERRRRALGAV